MNKTTTLAIVVGVAACLSLLFTRIATADVQVQVDCSATYKDCFGTTINMEWTCPAGTTCGLAYVYDDDNECIKAAAHRCFAQSNPGQVG